MNSPIEVAAIGAGAHATENLLPAICTTDGLRLRAICTRRAATADAAARRWGADVATTSWEEAVEGADALVVCSAPDVHEEAIRFAAERNLPLFVEKPPARSVAHLDHARSDAPGTAPVFVDYNLRFSDAWVTAGEIVPATDVRLLRIAMHARRPTEPWHAKTMARSLLLSVGIHALDLALATLGEPTSVLHTTTDLGDHRVNLSIVLGFDGGRTASLELSNAAAAFETRFDAISTSGTRVIVENLTTVTATPTSPPSWSDKSMEIVDLSGLRGGFHRSGYGRALESFAGSIRTGEAGASDLDLSRSILSVIDEVSPPSPTSEHQR